MEAAALTRAVAVRSSLQIASALLCIALPRAARAERPTLADEATFGLLGGGVLVHYAASGIDAVPAADADADGVPDFVAEVATNAELALAHYPALGFRRPLGDGGLGGDDRIDLYLRDLDTADGSVVADSCDGRRCIGFAIAENDFAGFAYASITEAIRSVVPHELFHLVQYAYAIDQPATWTEGSAVWAVEQLYGDGNSDFERVLPAFLQRTFRPFERPVAGFGDAYPYGAALWPYFLERRFGIAAVVDAWLASEHAPFLDAVGAALDPRGSSLDDAWIEFTRWNAFTGPRAAEGSYPEAAAWSEALREPAITAGGTIYLEGLSARYVPLAVANRSRVEVAPTGGIRIAAWLVADGDGIADGIELASGDEILAATVAPGDYTLVITGLSRGTITTAVDVALVEDSGGCSAGRSLGPASWLAALLVLRRRRAQR